MKMFLFKSQFLPLKIGYLWIYFWCTLNFESNCICTTADIWSSKKEKSFFEYTWHWIDPDFSRHSAALACHRFTGTHSFNKIADLIHFLNIDFGLGEEKVVCTITDNGSNFVKAFKEFGIKS